MEGIEVETKDTLSVSTRSTEAEDDSVSGSDCSCLCSRPLRSRVFKMMSCLLLAVVLIIISVAVVLSRNNRSSLRGSSVAAAQSSQQAIVLGPALPGEKCASSAGNRNYGIESYYDESCIGVGGLGCHTNNQCRYCKVTTTNQSKKLKDCPWLGLYADGGTITKGSPTTPTTTGGGASGGGNGVLFYDDFSTFNLKTWKHEISMAGGGNWEFQVYRNSRDNSYVDENGVLNIEPTLTEEWKPEMGFYSMEGITDASECNARGFYGCERQNINPISSAKIHTRDFTFSKGRLEVRARLPKGDWLWPAIWLLPKYENYGGWPRSGEIDVMEARGNAPGYGPNGGIGVDTIGSTLHWGLDPFSNQYEKTNSKHRLTGGDDFSDDFHIFGLVRHDNGLYTYVDDDSNRNLEVDWSSQSFYERGGWNPNNKGEKNIWTKTGSALKGKPFVDEEFYIIINLAVGGVNYFPEGFGNKPWENEGGNAAEQFWSAKDQWYPTWQKSGNSKLQIDWIKVTET